MSLIKTKVKLSLKEKLDIFPAVGSIFLTCIYALLTGFRRTERQAKTLSLHLGYALFRKASARLTATQMQYILPSDLKIYERYSKSTGKVPESVQLGDGALGHWVGDKNADNVIIWYHGMYNSSYKEDRAADHIIQGVVLDSPPTWAISNSMPSLCEISRHQAKALQSSV